jgi:hypothetical protein
MPMNKITIHPLSFEIFLKLSVVGIFELEILQNLSNRTLKASSAYDPRFNPFLREFKTKIIA